MDSHSTASVTSVTDISSNINIENSGDNNNSNSLTTSTNPDFNDSSYPGFDEESTVCCTARSVDTNLENEIHKNLAYSSDEESDNEEVHYQTLASLITHSSSSSPIPLSEFINGQVPKKTSSLKDKNESFDIVPIPLSETLKVLSVSSSIKSHQQPERKHEWGNFKDQGPVPTFQCTPFIPKDKSKKYEFQRTVVPPPLSDNHSSS